MERVAIKMRDGALETLRGSHWPAAVLALAAASSFCVGLIALRIVLSGHVGYAFLVWNLALAWVPLVLAVCLWVGYRRDWPRPLLGLAAVAWLLFLPNAPYILTDYVHLASGHRGERSRLTRWQSVRTRSQGYCWGLLRCTSCRR